MPTPPRTKRVTKTSSAKKPSRLKNTLRKAGSMTMLPYLAKAAGKDRLADAMGYPIGKDGKIKPELEFKNSAKNLRKRGEKAKPIGEKTVKRVSSAIKAAKNRVTKKKSGGKVTKLQPTQSGGQIYMSPEYAKEVLGSGNRTKTEKKIKELEDAKFREEIKKGTANPKKSGTKVANRIIDTIDESVRQKYEKPQKPKDYLRGPKPVAKKASGGSLNRKSPDGIATRGKTRLSTKGFGKIG